jgi:hypothetical protein
MNCSYDGFFCVSPTHYKNRFFERTPAVGFQKTDFGVFRALCGWNNKTHFLMGGAVSNL